MAAAEPDARPVPAPDAAPDVAPRAVPVVTCDLDGVVWLADEVIPGAPEAVARLRAAGTRVLFVSNNSFAPVATVEAKLARFGIPAVGDVVTSAQAAATLVHPGERVLLAGGPGIEEELLRRGCEVVRGVDHGVDAVVVGFHRTFDYEAMRCCAVAVRRGARLIGTNPDTTYPTPDGPIPGGGAILASVVAGAGTPAVVAGKPHPPMAAVVRSIVGDVDVVMVGDRHDTDGLFAAALGARFALVLSGVTHAHEVAGLQPAPDLVAADLAAVAGLLVG